VVEWDLSVFFNWRPNVDCDYTTQATATAVGASECSYPCAGDSGSLCGGQNRVYIYYNGAPPPTNKPVFGSWTYRGCFTYVLLSSCVISAQLSGLSRDNRVMRSLHKKIDIPGGVTVEKCASECKANNYGISGTEYGIECCAYLRLCLIFICIIDVSTSKGVVYFSREEPKLRMAIVE
jgi:hypothetical protein